MNATSVTIDHISLGRAAYSVWVQHSSEPFDVIERFDAMPDEFGTLQRLDSTQRFISQSGGDCHDFCDLGAAHEQHLRITYPESYAQRELERKQAAGHRVITAEFKPGDDWVNGEIVIDRDDRRDVPRYRIDAGFDDVAILTRAQLAALLFAAETIVKPARAKPSAVRYIASRRARPHGASLRTNAAAGAQA